MTAQSVLKDYFGFNEFRLEQENIINSVINKENTLGVMPTGGGKSLCYQIPSIIFSKENSGVTVVISPLISLMKDQVKSAESFGIKSAFLNSTTKADEKKHIWSELYEGRLNMLFISPERAMTLLDYIFKENIAVNAFAVDEAHCIVQWGHDFREDYQKVCTKLVQKKHQYKNNNLNVPIIALTATADIRTREDICKQLEIENKNMFVSSFYRPNISFSTETKYGNGLYQIRDFLEKNSGKPGIIYTNTKSEAERIGNQFGLHVYHAGMDINYRTQVQNAFIAGAIDVIVATSAFGMGIDKPDIGFILHSSIPYSLEDWYQQAGRAGRNGCEAVAHVLYDPSNALRIQGIYEATNNNNGLLSLNNVVDVLTSGECIWNALLGYFGEDSDDCDNCSICHKDALFADVNSTEVSRLAQSIFTQGRVKTSIIPKIILGERSVPLSKKRISEYNSIKKNSITLNGKKETMEFQREVISFIVNQSALAGYIEKRMTPRKISPFAFRLEKKSDIIEADIYSGDYSNYKAYKAMKKEKLIKGKLPHLDVEYAPIDNKGSTVSSSAFKLRKKHNLKKIEKIDVSEMSIDFNLVKDLKTARLKKHGRSKKELWRTMKDGTLMNIARAIPTTKDELEKIPGMGIKSVRRHHIWILDTVKSFLNIAS